MKSKRSRMLMFLCDSWRWRTNISTKTAFLGAYTASQHSLKLIDRPCLFALVLNQPDSTLLWPAYSS